MESAKPLLLYISDTSVQNESPTFQSFLSSVKIVPLNKESRHRISAKLRFRNDFKKYVKSLVADLLKNQSDNVLVSGLPKIKRSNYLSATNNSVYSSFVINELHSYNWKRLFEILGSMRMTDLLTNWKGFVSKEGSLIQIFGDRITYAGKKQTAGPSKLIKKSSIFHHLQSKPRYWDFSLINLEADELVQEIFGKNTKAKRFRKIKYLVNTIIKKDRACKYHLIYQKLLLSEKRIDPYRTCSNASPFPEVVQYVFVILGKLLSLEAWGGSANKAILRKRVEEYLKLDSKGTLHIHDIVKWLRLSDYQWLGTTFQVSSKQDFEIRQRLLQDYIQWLFGTVLKKIIRAFWYVTESTEGEILYFPRHIWHKISLLWLESYSRDNFVRSALIGNEHYNYGTLKLIPKRDTFRLICIPSKRLPSLLESKLTPESQKDQDAKFYTFRANVLRPVRLILQNKYNERAQKDSCYSTTASSSQQIADRLLAFKSQLLQKFSTVPQLYFIKFDMKECYDRMNQKKLIEKVISLFRDDKPETRYYYRSVGKMRRNLMQQTMKHFATPDLTDLNLLSNDLARGEKSVWVDTGKTIYLTRKQVISECIQQIFGAKGYIEDPKTHSLKFFRRKQGVFQGFSLSSIFCDILYSAMVAENFRFLWESDSPFLFARLVDDFLIITPDVDQYNKVLKVISDGRLQKYGAYVNDEKTQIIDHTKTSKTLQFVGLEIEVDTLNLSTNYSKFGTLSTSNYRTFSSLLCFLKTAYTSRLHEYMLICASNSFQNTLKNVSDLLQFIMAQFKCKFQKLSTTDTFNPGQFNKFLLSIISLTLDKFGKCNKSCDLVDDFLDSMLTTLADALAHGPQYKEVIKYLMESSLEDVGPEVPGPVDLQV